MSHQGAGISQPGHWQWGLRLVTARRCARFHTGVARPTARGLPSVVGGDGHDGGVAEDLIAFAGVDHSGEQAERQRVRHLVGGCVRG